jgi:hypothetical protein
MDGCKINYELCILASMHIVRTKAFILASTFFGWYSRCFRSLKILHYNDVSLIEDILVIDSPTNDPALPQRCGNLTIFFNVLLGSVYLLDSVSNFSCYRLQFLSSLRFFSNNNFSQRTCPQQK